MGLGIGFGFDRGIGIMNSGGGGDGATGVGQTFNGLDQYAYVTDNGDLDIVETTEYFSLSCKISIDDLVGNERAVGKISGSANSQYGIMNITDKISGYFRLEDANKTINFTASINTEYHLLLVINKISVESNYYVDGELIGTLPSDGSFENLANDIQFIIGAANDGKFFTGTIKDVRIYHKNVVTDLTDLMAGKKLGDEIAWWDLPDLNDKSGNGYDLTGVNL
jgi:hypothetical protein